jgi:hypothetical protein
MDAPNAESEASKYEIYEFTSHIALGIPQRNSGEIGGFTIVRNSVQDAGSIEPSAH